MVLEVTIHKWIKLYSPIKRTHELTVTEVAAVKKVNLHLKREVEILKSYAPIHTKTEDQELINHITKEDG